MQRTLVQRTLAVRVLSAVAGIMLPASLADAVPINQKIFKVDVTSAWEQCVNPGLGEATSTNSGFLACLSPNLVDPLCKFSPRGKGKVRLVAGRDNVRVFGVLSGVEAGCEAQTLNLIMSARITTDDCPPGVSPPQPCTLVELVDFPLGSCTIQNGVCSIVTTVNSAAPSLVGLSKRTHFELNGCGFRRTTGVNPPARTFSCGIKVP
jgi:hypothetical protein